MSYGSILEMPWTATGSADSLRRDHLAPIVRTARADLPHLTDFEVLRMPADKPTTDQLVSAALTTARTAKLHTAIFVTAACIRPSLMSYMQQFERSGTVDSRP